eukprot:12900847-Prorocentrum_lima.AAC.1
MSDERVALPVKVDVAIGLDMHDGGRAATNRKIFIGWGTPKFHSVADLVVHRLNCGARFGL